MTPEALVTRRPATGEAVHSGLPGRLGRPLRSPGQSPGAAEWTGVDRNQELVIRYQHEQDVDSLDVLLKSNEKLLHHVLKRFDYADEPYEDLLQVARLGLVKAAQRFEAARGACFATYAVAVVDGEVRHYLRDGLLMRQPRWARQLYRRIQEGQADFFRREQRFPSMEELARAVNVQEKGLLEILRVFAALNLHSLDEGGFEPEELDLDLGLVRSQRQESFTLPIEDRITLYQALNRLSEFQRRLLYLLFFRGLTQQEAADELGSSQRAVSREQTKALSRLKSLLNKKIF